MPSASVFIISSSFFSCKLLACPGWLGDALITVTSCPLWGILAGHPLDTTKTRLQAMPRFDHSNAYRVLVDTARALAVMLLLLKHVQFWKVFWLLQMHVLHFWMLETLHIFAVQRLPKPSFFFLDSFHWRRFARFVRLLNLLFLGHGYSVWNHKQPEVLEKIIFHLDAVWKVNDAEAIWDLKDTGDHMDVSSFSVRSALIL